MDQENLNISAGIKSKKRILNGLEKAYLRTLDFMSHHHFCASDTEKSLG